MQRLRSGIAAKLKRAIRFLREEEASAAAEYAVVLALIVLTCLASIMALGPALLSPFQSSAQTVGTYGVE